MDRDPESALGECNGDILRPRGYNGDFYYRLVILSLFYRLVLRIIALLFFAIGRFAVSGLRLARCPIDL